VFSGGMIVEARERKAAQQTWYKYYTTIEVEAGDSLWNIAGRYMEGQSCTREEYIRELCRINHLRGDSIQTGQVLTVAYYSTEYK